MSKRARIFFDAFLSGLLIFEMYIQLTGDFLHEVVGALFCIGIVTHLIFSHKWIAGVGRAWGKKKFAGKQRVLMVIAALLAVDMLALILSSLAISQVLAESGIDTSWLGSVAFWSPVHTASAYLLCIIVLAHLTTHWVQVANAFRIDYDPSRRRAIGYGVKGMAVLGGVALGVAGYGALNPTAALGGTGAAPASSAAGTDTAATSAVQDRGVGAAAATASNQAASTASSSTSSTSTNAATATASATTASDTVASSSSSSASSSTSTATNDGICTICHKNCPLSAPQCNRPYEAGLTTVRV